MKKIYTLVCMIILGFSVNALAQNNSVTLPNISSEPGPITVQVDYDFSIDDVYSFEILVKYDQAELTYEDYSAGDIPDDADFQIDGSTPGEIDIAWSKATGISNDGVLVYLNFEYIGTGGITNITFRPTTYSPGDSNPAGTNPSWLGDNSAPVLVITSTFNNGSITYVSPVPLSIWAVLLGIFLIATFAVTRFYRIV